MRHAATVLSAAFLLNSAGASAQGPPIQTDTPIMLGLEGRGVRATAEVKVQDLLREHGREARDPLRRVLTTYGVSLAMPYNVATTLQLGAVIPIVRKQLESTAGDVSHSGLGDAALFIKKLVLQVDRPRETIRVALKGTLKLPTGEDDPPIPSGTGSVDYAGGIVSAWIKGRFGFYGEATHRRNTSHEGVDYGDGVVYNAAIGFRAAPGSYPLYPSSQVNLYLELNGGVAARARRSGQDDPDSGGSLLLLSPGIQYVGGRRWLVEASVQIPLVDRPNGTQLGTAGAARVGSRVLLF